MRKKLAFIWLGCDKNRVDSEKFLGRIEDKFILTSDIREAQIVVINSCAFLEGARKEALDVINECNGYREKGKVEKIILTGCYPQGFIDEIYEEFPQVDGFLGTYDYNLFLETVDACYKGQRVNNVKKGGEKLPPPCQRIFTGLFHVAYLKIADGCDNKCTYCIIPKIKGGYFSLPMEYLVEEAKNLGEVCELILVAQDVTNYGTDLYGKRSLCRLIRKLSELDNIHGIRLLYCYPELVDDELIHELATNPKLIKYLDIPLQHASDAVLKRMNRKGTYASYMALINKLRQEVRGIALRSTFITGFPGETRKDLKTLEGFLSNTKLDAAGFFAFSAEPGAPASNLPDQVDEPEKFKRLKRLYRLQGRISMHNLERYKGKTLEVLCDYYDEKISCYVGRTYFQIPDSDGRVYFFGDTPDEKFEPGKYYWVKIEETDAYDLVGPVVPAYSPGVGDSRSEN